MIKYDEIRIDELEIFAHHGVYDYETKNGQKFYVNAILYTDTHKAGVTDELSESTNYGEVCSFITDFLTENTYKLLEAAAENVTEAILLNYPLINGVSLEIRKPEAPIGLRSERSAIYASVFSSTSKIPFFAPASIAILQIVRRSVTVINKKSHTAA